MNPSRREFLAGLTKLAGGAALGLAVLPLVEGCTPSSVPLLPEQPSAPIGPDGTVTVNVALLSQASPAFQVPNLTAPDGFGVMVTLTPDGTMHALSMRCTHAGCSVNSRLVHGDINCPCHGSLFALDGTVIQSPAVTPLTSYPLTYDASTKVATIKIK